MDKPRPITTTRRLPFSELSPADFEQLCLRLIKALGYRNPEHYGSAGSDGGRDIVAYMLTDAGEQLWYFQCKRYGKISAADLISEVDKIHALEKHPAGIVFATSAEPTADTRDRVSRHCSTYGYACQIWGRSELDLHLSEYPDIVAHFFGPPATDHRPLTTTPHELPPPPADFTGREKELKALLASIASGGVTISGLRGLGGIGKTALGLKLGELLKHRFPDGQLYVDLMGFGGSKPLTPAQAQARVITAFHPEAKISEDPGAVAGLYRSTLSGKRALLLMDNALDAEQVGPLIPPTGSVLIVTSRNRFTLPGLSSTDLDVLPAEDARALLLKIAPRVGALADEIGRLCGCLALALRAAASLIAETPGLEVAEYITRLGDERTRLWSLRTENPELDVQASITVSYELLDPRSQRMLRDLSVFPASFDRAAALAVCEDPEGRRLDGLARKSLVEFDVEAKRYHIHDLVRIFARSRASEQETEVAARNHALHFLAVLWECDRLYKEGGDGILAGLRLFDLEWPNLHAGQAWAERYYRADVEAARACSGYPDAGAKVLGFRQRPEEQIGWLLPAFDAAKRLADRRIEGMHLGNLGNAYLGLGNYRRAITFYEQHLAIAQEFGDKQGEGNAVGNMGVAYRNLGEYRRAVEFFERRLAVALEIGDGEGASDALGNLGNVYHDLGQYHRAIEFHQQHLAIAREIGDRRGEGTGLGNLGNAYYSLEEYRRAIGFHEQHLAIAQEIGDRRGEGNALGNIGISYYSVGEHNRAIEFHQQHLAIAREIGDRRGEENALGNIGIVYHALGKYSGAIEFHKQRLAIAKQIGDRSGEGTALWNLSQAFDKIGERGRAIQCAHASFKIRQEIEDPRAAKVRNQLAQWNAPME